MGTGLCGGWGGGVRCSRSLCFAFFYGSFCVWGLELVSPGGGFAVLGWDVRLE